MSEALNGFFVLIMILGIIVGIIAALVLLVMAIRKSKLKVPLWITGSSFFIALLGLSGVTVIAIVNTFNEPIANSTTSSNSTPSTETSDYEAESDEPENEEEIETILEDEDDEDSHLTKDGRNPSDLSEYQSNVDIRDVERKPEEFKDEWIAFEGKIIQVMENDVNTAYRIAVNDDFNQVVYVEVLTNTLKERLLEDDHVTVYGSFHDLVTYETVMGSSKTIPAFNAHGERVILKEGTE